MENKLYAICMSSEEFENDNCFCLVGKNVFNEKENAQKICDEIQECEQEEGIKYYVLEMEVL